MPRLIVCRLLTHASDAAHPHPATGGVRPGPSKGYALPWRSCLVSTALAETLDQSTIMLDLVGDDQLAIL